MWVAVDKDGEEWIYEKMPIKHTSSGYWVCVSVVDCIKVPKGTIQRLLNYPLTWDDEAEEIVKYKDNNILKKDKMIKQNIKMRVTPEQSRKVQEICFNNGVYWNLLPEEWDIRQTTSEFLYIEDVITHSFSESPYSDDDFKEENDFFNEQELEEIDADLFIRTNGTCEDTTLNDDDIIRILKAPEDQPIEYLRQKIVNLHDQLNKYRKTVQNQKEELTRLLVQKEDLQNRLNTANETIKILSNNGDDLVEYLEEKDTIIKYLENKLEI